ncbi:MAG TPA: aldehyde dehydrogenase family protein, partial [Elusimicrobiota bacterium]|nr:aldehyde dehydrogenase family protein [Elusimicrobiota bacterium]
AHPKPNRLRSVLGLGAKNAAIVLPDADLDLTVKEGVAGALTFNGQRCTALKIFFVHRSVADRFVSKMAEAVAALRRGLPFEDGVQITPLPDVAMVEKMGRYVENARSKGARVANPGGGESERTFFSPAVVYPVAPSMALWREEQFGPVVPVAAYESLDEVIDYLAGSDLGQQASVFGREPKALGGLIDALVNQVCRVNLNAQCRRGPDTFPFGGRKDSAEGTLSVTDALRVFSLRTLAAGVDRPETRDLMERLAEGGFSRFLSR